MSTGHPLLYLTLAAGCLMLAARLARDVLAPVMVVLRAAAALTAFVLAISIAVALMVAAVVTGGVR